MLCSGPIGQKARGGKHQFDECRGLKCELIMLHYVFNRINLEYLQYIPSLDPAEVSIRNIQSFLFSVRLSEHEVGQKR